MKSDLSGLVCGVLLLAFFAPAAFAVDPIARDDDFITASGQTVSGLLSSNDEGLDGPLDSYSLLTAPQNGSASVSSNGSFSYTPNIGFAGIDTFSYAIDDGAGGTSSAFVNITVNGTSDFLSSASPILFTLEDTQVPLGLSVAPDLFNGGALQDLISTDALFRSDSAGSAPVSSVIPAGASSIAITGYSTQSRDTAGSNDSDDDYQLLNVRINLVDGSSSGRVAFLNDGRLSLLDQYSWAGVPLGQAVLTDPSKITGFFATGNSNPIFSVVAGSLQIVETHTLESAYVIEYLTSDGDSTNFLGAGNTVQNAGVDTSTLAFPIALEPSTGKKGVIALNTYSAATGSDFNVEHKGFARLLIDIEAGSVSGSIAALRGETAANTVTYSFKDYPLIDQRVSGATTVDILSSSATVVGDITADATVVQNPTLYIDTSGQLVIERASGFAAVFTSIYTAEYYERTGFSSIASFVSVGSADALFDSSPPDGVDEFGDPINELVFNVPASASVGLIQMSWNTIGGTDTNENIGMGFAVIDLANGTSSGSISFIRTTSPDLLSWDGVPYGTAFFGSTDGAGNPLYQSNKNAGGFTDRFVEASAFTLNNNADGSRTLTFTATSNGGTGAFLDYRGNANISWLGNEPFSISGIPTTGLLSHGSPNGSGEWEIDFADIPLLAYQPAPHESGTLSLGFTLSSTGESEILELRIAPVADAPMLSSSDLLGYVDNAFDVGIVAADSADTDGSETQSTTVTLASVPSTVNFSASTGNVIDLGSGVWTIDRSALPTLLATSSSAVDAVITVSMLQIDERDVDADGIIEDGDNGNGIDESDELLVTDSFVLRVQDIPTITQILVNSGTPIISGTASPLAGESLTVTVNGISYPDTGPDLVVNGDGTWTLTIPLANTLPENTYSVSAELSHTSGTSGADTSVDELIIDLTPPVVPGITSQATMDVTPLITGTLAVASGNTLRVTVNGIQYTQGDGNLVDNGDGTWQLQIPVVNALADALYQVSATLTDPAGNQSNDASVDELLVDTLAPPGPGVTSQSTNDTSPIIEGTAVLANGDTLRVAVNGIVYTAGDGQLVDNGDGTWTLQIPPANILNEGVYDVTATITDAASNIGTDPSSSELVVDLTAPAAPSVTAQLSNQATPVLIGTATVGTGEVLSVTVGTVVYTDGDGNLVDNGDGTWTLAVPLANALVEGVFEVTATVTDAAGNSTSDSSTSELEIDLTAPVAPAVDALLSNTDIPVITGTATLAAGETLSVTVNGVIYIAGDGNLVDNGDGTWMLAIPVGNELPEGTLDITVTVTDSAGNSTSDGSTGELELDLTPPVQPTITALLTNSVTPVITGTATVAPGEILSVSVNGDSYVAGDGNLVDNADGTWTITVPLVNALPEGILEVTATVADTAGNTTFDSSTNEITVDLTPPVAATVDALLSNTDTPVIAGTATVAAGETLSVTVNGVTYLAGDGNLIDNGDGTWMLAIPAGNELPEGTLDITVIVTDAAGNSTSDGSTGELALDLTPPVAPTVDTLLSNTDTPVITGTATVAAGEALSVTVNGVTYTAGDGNLVDNGDGTWMLAIPVGNELPEGALDITVTVTDSAGNSTSDSSSSELELDLTPPVAPTVDALLSNTDTPVITGTATVAAGETLSVTVNGVTYIAGGGNLVDNGDGTWMLAIPVGNELPEGVLDIAVTVVDSAGNSTSDGSTGELELDLTPPVQPTVNALLSNSDTPVITGTATVATGETLSVTVNGVTYIAGDGNLIDNGDGTWMLAIPLGNELPEGTLDITVIVTDAAGNSTSDGSTGELALDLTPPVAPTVDGLLSNTDTPVITGTATVAAGEALSVTVNGVTYTAGDGNLVDNGDGTWMLAIPVGNELPEGALDVTVTVTDIAGNSSSNNSTGDLELDLTPPVQPTVNALLSNSDTPVVTGTATIAAGETLSVTVNGVTYIVGDGNLIDNGDGTWMLAIPVGNELPEGTFDVTVTVRDSAGNSSSDSSSGELELDLTPPVAPTVDALLSNTDTPVITGTATVAAGETLRVTVNGVTYIAGDGNLVDNGDGTWMLAIPAGNELPEGASDITVTVEDTAGNSTSDGSTGELELDLTPPVQPTVNALLSNSDTPVISGTATVAIGETLSVTVNGVTYIAGDGNLIDNGDGTWELAIPAGNELPEGVLDISVTVTDIAGNSTSDSTSGELELDLTPPVQPTITALLTNDVTPIISGTATVAPGEILSVFINGDSYVAGDGNLVDNADGTWTLTVPLANALQEGILEVTATVADTAGNTTFDSSTNEITVDLTPPLVPVVTSQLTNTATPIIEGTAVLGTGETLTVAVNGIVYTVGDGNLADNADGTWTLTIPASNAISEGDFDVIATVTDGAQNSSANTGSNELMIDLTAPATPTATTQLANSATPTLTGTATVAAGETLSVTVNGITYSAGNGNLVDNGDGTWELVIPVGNELPEGTLDITVAVTDSAGNSTSDSSSGELELDLTPPVAPTVDTLLTNTDTPTITGTATVATGETLSVTVNGVTYIAGDGNFIDNGDGTWMLAIPAGNELPEGALDITVTVVDSAGNSTSDGSTDELELDLTPPVAPTVDALLSNTDTPVITGTATVAAGETLSVTVNGVTYIAGDGNLVDNGDGTWMLAIPAGNELPEGVLDISVTVTDTAGNSTSDSTSGELELDLTPPVQPTITALLTNSDTPMISGAATVAPGEILSVFINGDSYVVGDGNLVDNGDGTWTLTVPQANALPEGILEVTATVADTAGNTTFDSTTNEVTVDLMPPPVPVVTSLLTNSATPVIEGTAILVASDTLTVTVNGIVYTAGDGNLVDNGDGTWTLTVPASNAIPEGDFDVIATVTDGAQNSSANTGSSELMIDLTAPVVPTVTTQLANSSTPTLAGTATVAAGEALSVIVNGVTYIAGDGNLIDNGDGTWELVIPVGNELPEGTLDITVTVTDSAGNSTSDSSSGELELDLTPPVEPTVDTLLSNTDTPTITGTAIVAAGETLSVTVNGVTYIAGDGNLVDNGDGTWVLSIPAGNELPEGTLDITVTVTDTAGNSASNTSSGDLELDLTSPVQPTITALLTNSAAPIVTGTAIVAPGEILSVFINGDSYVAGDGNLVDNADGTWTLAVPQANALPEGILEVTATVADTAGNTTFDSSTNELTVDLTPPPAPGVTSQTTNDNTPLIEGTTTIGSGLTLRVEVNGVIYVEGDGNLINNGDGTWALSIPPTNTLADAPYQVIATLTDAAGNVSTDTGTDELLIDTMLPQSPGVTSLVINTATPVIEGTVTLAVGETLTVAVNGIVYTAGDGNLVDNGDGTWTLTVPVSNALPEGDFDVIATVTDVALNTSSDPSSGELTIDLSAPMAPTVDALLTNSPTPTLSGTVTLAPGETLAVTINGITYIAGDGNLVDNADGTWTLMVPNGDELPEGVFNVAVLITDAAGNITSDASTAELLIDLSASSAPTLRIVEDVDNDGILSLAEPASPITVALGLPIDSAVGDRIEVSDGSSPVVVVVTALDIAAGQVFSTFSRPAEGASIIVEAIYIDGVGNRSLPGSDTALIDTLPALTPVVSILEDIDDNDFIGRDEFLGDIDIRVTLPANAVAGDTLVVNINGTDEVLTLDLASIAAGVVNLMSAPPMNGESVTVLSTIIDIAGNISLSGSDTALIDLTEPALPTINTLISNTGSPTIAGLANLAPGETLTITVNGITYIDGDGSLVANSDGSWTLTLPTTDTLDEGLYDVTATITDLAGNSSTEVSVNGLLVDLTAPAPPSVDPLLVNTATPTITGTAVVGSDETLSVTLNGVTYTAGDGVLVDNGDGTWALAVPVGSALSEGVLDVSVSITDAAGNSTGDVSFNEIEIDLTPPAAPGVTSQTTGNDTPLIEGTTTPGFDNTLSVEVDGVVYTDGDGSLTNNGDGTWVLNITAANSLADALYQVVASLTDAAGNTHTDTGSDELLVDTASPLSPGITSQTINTGTPIIEGTASLLAGEMLSVRVNGLTYIAGDGNLFDNGDGTWILIIPPAGALPEGQYDVVATITDAALNTSTDPSSGELTIDLTAPISPTANAQLANSATPTINGTAALAPDEILTVVLNGVTYVAGDGNLVVNGDGTWMLVVPTGNALPDGSYVVTVNVLDTAGNISSESGQILEVDTIAPDLLVTALGQVTTFRPTLSGTTTAPNGTLVSVLDADGNLYCESIVIDNTWSCVSTFDLSEGDTPLIARITDVAGNVSVANFVISVSTDFDNDGIPNAVEGFGDTDGDGIADSYDLDTDNDGIVDRREGTEDSDGDDIEDYRDLDSDNDGIADLIEALGNDVDGNNVVDNFIDTDNNGLSDNLQSVPLLVPDTDQDGIADFLDVDSDQDGIADLVETQGSDIDDDGRVDAFVDNDADGVDDGIQLMRAQLVDSDADELPDYRDLDSDNDGIKDIVEAGGIDLDNDGLVDGGLDINRNGIPDSVDVAFTNGRDSDGDGIDDFADASITFGDDSDGDDILDEFDPDSNGDGRIDTALSDLILGAALPDTDLNGIPDFQQADNGALRTGLSGRGGCSVSPATANQSWEFMFLLMAGLALLGIITRSQRQRVLRRLCVSDACSVDHSRYAVVVVAVVLLFAASFVSAKGLQFGPYIGLGVGQSYLDPDSTNVPIDVEDNTDVSFSALLGLDLSPRFALELSFDDLGQADLTNNVHLNYQITHASMLWRGFNSREQLARHQGFSLFGRVGVARMDNSANFSFIRENDTSFMFGGGVEYGFSNGIALRADLTSFDTDAHRIGAFLLYRLQDGGRKNNENISPTLSVAEVPKRVVPEIEATQITTVISDTPSNDVGPIVSDDRQFTVLFDANSSVTDLPAKVVAVNVAAALRYAPALSVKLTGYADTDGSAKYNHWLAERRVKRVRDLLELRGVAPARIESVVHGETTLFDAFDLFDVAQPNRRVQIELVSD